MKKSLLLAALGLSLLGLAAASQAATTLTYNLVVTISTSAIDISGPAADGAFIPFGSPVVPGNTTGALAKMIFNNLSSVSTIHFNLSAGPVTGFGWTYDAAGDPSAGLPPANQYRMSAMFTQWDRVPAPNIANFQANDVLTAAATPASATQFAWDTEADNFKGFGVTTGQAKDMFVLIEAGAATTATAGTITPTITIAAATAMGSGTSTGRLQAGAAGVTGGTPAMRFRRTRPMGAANPSTGSSRRSWRVSSSSS